MLHIVQLIHEAYMTHKMLRVRIRDNIYKKFQIACIQNDLSLPKQTEKLISDFIKSKDVVEIPFEMIDQLNK